VPELEQTCVGLGGELQGVAAVGEHRGSLGEHDGQTGAAGEPGEPAEAFGARRDVFAEVLVGARDEEAVEVLDAHGATHSGQALVGLGHTFFIFA